MLLEGGSGGDSRLGSRHGRSTLRNTLAAVNAERDAQITTSVGRGGRRMDGGGNRGLLASQVRSECSVVCWHILELQSRHAIEQAGAGSASWELRGDLNFGSGSWGHLWDLRPKLEALIILRPKLEALFIYRWAVRHGQQPI
jgi:hypothetical protein